MLLRIAVSSNGSQAGAVFKVRQARIGSAFLKPCSSEIHLTGKRGVMDPRFLSPVLLWPYAVGCPVSAPNLTLHALTPPTMSHSWPRPERERPEPAHPTEDGPSTTLNVGVAASGYIANVAAQQSVYVANTAPHDLFAYFSRIPKTWVSVREQPTRKYVVRRNVMPRQSIGTRTGR